MSHTYTPTYYTSLHDSITSICKTILPFPFKKKRLPAIAAAEHLLEKQQSDNLKWQQESFHQIHNLMGLCKEGILREDEVSSFREHLLETLIASPLDYEPPLILRDKLIFLQELLYANCISEDVYHASKRPLLQRLAVQGAEIKETDVVVRGAQNNTIPNEEWSAIDLEEEKCLGSTFKKTKGASMLAFVSPNKYGKLKEDKDASDSYSVNARPKDRYTGTARCAGNELMNSTENPFWNSGFKEKESGSKSVFLMESLPEKETCSERGKRKPFKALFQREPKEENDVPALDNKENAKLVKKTWGFDGFKKWKKTNVEDETTPFSPCDKSHDASYNRGVAGKEPETKKIKKKLHCSQADFILDEEFGENISKEVSRIQSELTSRTPHFRSSNGNAVLDVVKQESKDHIEERQISEGREKRNSKRWTTFDDEENSHPNLFAPQDESYTMKQARFSSSKTVRASFNNTSIDKGFKYNPFFDM